MVIVPKMWRTIMESLNEFIIYGMVSALEENTVREKDTCSQVTVGRSTRKDIVPCHQDFNKSILKA